jgi:hypothetical protein
MQKLLVWLDKIAEIEREHLLPRWLERITFIFLILMIFSAPHSIAATQIAWLSGMFLWMIRLFIKPRRKLLKTPLDIALTATVVLYGARSVLESIKTENLQVEILRNEAGENSLRLILPVEIQEKVEIKKLKIS